MDSIIDKMNELDMERVKRYEMPDSHIFLKLIHRHTLNLIDAKLFQIW